MNSRAIKIHIDFQNKGYQVFCSVQRNIVHGNLIPYALNSERTHTQGIKGNNQFCEGGEVFLTHQSRAVRVNSL